VDADEKTQGVETEREGQEPPVGAAEGPADFGQLGPGEKENRGQAAQSEGQAVKKTEGFPAHRFFLP